MLYEVITELELELGIAPCTVLSALNNRGVAAACELDVANAVPMRALSLASQEPATVLDWNNNYEDDPDKCILFHCGPVPQKLMTRITSYNVCYTKLLRDKCILFHCGPVPQKLMTAKGQIIQHPMFVKSFGDGCGWGCNAGRIAPADIRITSYNVCYTKLLR